jgi:hypothetical protein
MATLLEEWTNEGVCTVTNFLTIRNASAAKIHRQLVEVHESACYCAN